MVNQFLLTEGSFHATYLLSRWLTEVGDSSIAPSVLLRDELGSAELYRARWAFHQRHQGQRELAHDEWADLNRLYPYLSDAEYCMIRLWGIPGIPDKSSFHVALLGKDLNSQPYRAWLEGNSRDPGHLFIYVFLDRILAPWWIELSGNRIINGHSAVLPYARGMFAIEQVAASGDIDYFRRSAGATIHYVDAGVDTGLIVRAERLANPFDSDSIWECKAFCYMLAFDLLVGAARDYMRRPETIPVGGPNLLENGSEYRSLSFTRDVRTAAEEEFLRMKRGVIG
jgi:phosphoribosylglycinamide formyltransferase-1